MSALDLPPLTYLSFDSVVNGVGASQVVPYVSRLARRGLAVELHSFEPSVDASMAAALADAGVQWKPHAFGAGGAVAGLGRVVRGARAVRGAALVHARSHPAGFAAVLARCPRWVWDVRSIWSEQRIDQGMLRRGSPAERTVRRLEKSAACRSTGVVTLSQTAIPALEARTGCAVAAKARVISTCVDLDVFGVGPLLSVSPVRVLASGTLNKLYDVPAMLAFVDRLRLRRPAVLERVGAGGSPWEAEFAAAGVSRSECSFSEMPARLLESHAGVCLLRGDAASATAATPTKVAEFLACGRPVVVSPGLGDLPALLESGRCGVVLAGTDVDALDRAAAQLEELLDDAETPARCRAVADRHFNIETAVDTLLDLYRTVTDTFGGD